jgi:cyanophycinase
MKLILIGGAEDKTGQLEVLKNVAKAANLSNIVLIPTASAYPNEVENNYAEAFRKLNVSDFNSLNIRNNDDCDKPEFIELIEKANLVFFGGGDQVKLVHTLENSKLLGIIRKRFSEGSLIVAGTSAGAASASENMLFEGDYHGFIKGRVQHAKGFGFIKKVVVDTHFMHRERIPRLTQMLALGIETKAIGIDEDTAVFIDKQNNFEVVGSGMVTLLNAEDVTYNDYHEIKNDNTYNINNLKIGFLSRGAKFNLDNWSVIRPQYNVLNEDELFHNPQLISPGMYI